MIDLCSIYQIAYIQRVNDLQYNGDRPVLAKHAYILKIGLSSVFNKGDHTTWWRPG